MRHVLGFQTLLAAICLSGAIVVAQDEPEVVPEGRIVGKVWHTNVQFEKGFEYLRKVGEELEIPQSPVLMMVQPGGLRLGGGLSHGKQDVELKGTLIFLQTVPRSA